MRVTIVGSGVMGCSLAAAFLGAGLEVTLAGRREASLAEARGRAAAALNTLVTADRLNDGDVEAALGRLATTCDVVAAAHAADWVLEAIDEDLTAKQVLFSALETAMRPSAWLTSTTSTLPVADLARELTHPERMLVTHFVNPPHLIPVVEVLPHPNTPEATTLKVEEALRQATFSPVRLRRDVPGFLANRLQLALLREALQLLQEGVADAAAIDTVVRDGLGPRWAFMGPLQVADFGGLATFERVGALLFPDLQAGTPDVLQRLVAAGRTGVDAGAGFFEYTKDAAALAAWRDACLLAILRAKSGQREA